MDYEILLKFVLPLIGLLSGLAWNVRKMYEAHLKRNDNREITVKLGDAEVNVKGISVSELDTVFKRIPKMIKDPDKPNLLSSNND